MSSKSCDNDYPSTALIQTTLLANYHISNLSGLIESATELMTTKHLAFAETTAECKQNRKIICNPILSSEPPQTTRRSKTQALSLPQKEFLHAKVRELIDNGFMIKINEDKVKWISETRIVPKLASEIDSNVSLEEL
ncbi:uncharacterized protein UTRI_05599 [Ustilago trichophora]|uniref:Uncharacterized protein n=1 Tax=Ustilago trichophora TaxID=86804 RepID=A0A5C3EG43_9BASI|nr:uncharacterized protein UTRI_05599 [Ustilago trichophora]